MLQLTGHATGRCNSQHEEDWDAARQVYWPGQKLMMMMHHSTAQRAHTRHAFALFIISCHGMGQHVWRVPKDQWSILAGSSLMTLLAPLTHTNSFIYLQIHFRRPKCSLILWQPTSPPPPVCLLGKQLFLFCDLVGCARCPLLLLFPWWLMSEISELKVVATLLIAKWLRQRTWTNSGPEQQPATITNALPP